MIEGRSRKEMEQESQESWRDISIEEHMAIYENQGIARKEAMKMVAKDRGVTKEIFTRRFCCKNREETVLAGVILTSRHIGEIRRIFDGYPLKIRRFFYILKWLLTGKNGDFVL